MGTREHADGICASTCRMLVPIGPSSTHLPYNAFQTVRTIHILPGLELMAFLGYYTELGFHNAEKGTKGRHWLVGLNGYKSAALKISYN